MQIQKQKMQKKGGGNKKNKGEKQQRQIKNLKKKMDRIGLYREDGKAYKTKSLKKLDMKSSLLPEHAKRILDDPDLVFNFPAPSFLSNKDKSKNLLQFDNVSCGYNLSKPIVKNISLTVQKNSRVALIAKNGYGKTTLMELIKNLSFNNNNQNNIIKNTNIDEVKLINGNYNIDNSDLTIGHISQHHIDQLLNYMDKNSCELLIELKIFDTMHKARSHLAKFGIRNKTALLSIKKLSGGQRTRLSMALSFAKAPSLLLLDEPTNSLDIRSREALEVGLNKFEGAFILITHDVSLLRNTCTELWTINKNGIFSILIKPPILDNKLITDLTNEEIEEIHENFSYSLDDSINKIYGNIN